MSGLLRDAARELIAGAAFALPSARRKALERWLRGREEFRQLSRADVSLVSFGKSGRTWLRLMLSRYYQLRYGLPESALLEFDNLKRMNPEIPAVFFTHGNYLRDYTGHPEDQRDFYDGAVIFLARDPRDVAVSQFFQWKFRMRPRKKWLNDYPPHGEELSIYEFVMEREAGLRRVVDFLNLWARELPKIRASHLVRYEDLRARPEPELRACLEFMGSAPDPELVAGAVRYASVENMRRLEEGRVFRASGRRLRPGQRGNPDSYKVRRAVVGGWRDYFSEEQVRAIDARVQRELDPVYGYGRGGEAGLPARAGGVA